MCLGLGEPTVYMLVVSVERQVREVNENRIRSSTKLAFLGLSADWDAVPHAKSLDRWHVHNKSERV